MFSILKQVFIVLLSFSISLATECLFLNGESCMVGPTLVDLNPVELKYYPFMISFDKCRGISNVLTPKIRIPKESKNINIKAFSMIANKNEVKRMTKHISYDFKCNFNSTTCNSNQESNKKTCQCECNCRKCKCK